MDFHTYSQPGHHVSFRLKTDVVGLGPTEEMQAVFISSEGLLLHFYLLQVQQPFRLLSLQAKVMRSDHQCDVITYAVCRVRIPGQNVVFEHKPSLLPLVCANVNVMNSTITKRYLPRPPPPSLNANPSIVFPPMSVLGVGTCVGVLGGVDAKGCGLDAGCGLCAGCGAGCGTDAAGDAGAAVGVGVGAGCGGVDGLGVDANCGAASGTDCFNLLISS